MVGSNTEANGVRIAIWSLIICSADMFELVVCGGQEMVSKGGRCCMPTIKEKTQGDSLAMDH